LKRGYQGGKVAGLLNKKLSRGYCGLTLEQRQEAGRKGGLLTGSANGLKNKELERGIFAPKVTAKAGIISTHKRWHVTRGIVSAVCGLCQGEPIFDEFAEQYESQVRHRDIEVERCKCAGCIKIRLRSLNEVKQTISAVPATRDSL
jgi:hypothetical protein